MSYKVWLSYEEMYHALSVGVQRELDDVFDGKKHIRGGQTRSPWTLHIVGALGEKAVSLFMGIPWDGNIGDLKAPDAGPYQVRTATNHAYNLLVYPVHDAEKPDDSIFIAASSDYEVPQLVMIHGWQYTEFCRNDRFLRTAGSNWTGGPCYFVPQRLLRPMSELMHYHREGNMPPMDTGGGGREISYGG